ARAWRGRGWRAADHRWKSSEQIVRALVVCAAGAGNLLLNVGPKGDGSLPEPAVRLLDAVGDWLAVNGASIYQRVATSPYLVSSSRSCAGVVRRHAGFPPTERWQDTDRLLRCREVAGDPGAVVDQDAWLELTRHRLELEGAPRLAPVRPQPVVSTARLAGRRTGRRRPPRRRGPAPPACSSP